MRSPEEPASRGAAGSVAPKARQRYKHERTGMHVPAGQQRPTRGGMTAREMVRDTTPPLLVSRSVCRVYVRLSSSRALTRGSQTETTPVQMAPVPFWRERGPQTAVTPRGGSGGGKRPMGYMGWRPGETYDLSDVKHSERTINRPMTAGDFISPLEERAAMRGCTQKSSGYRGHIPQRFDVPISQPGGRGDAGQLYINHHPGRVGHPDMPDTVLEPQVPSREHRTIEKDPSKLAQRARPEVRHMFEKTQRGVPRGARNGVAMGYAGHVPKLFGGLKASAGVEPSLLNGPGLCEQPRVNVRLRCALFSTALAGRVRPLIRVLATLLVLYTVREVDAVRITQRTNCAQRVAARPFEQDSV
eukprot:COSAG02_NODE_6924_length_3285_cov_1.475204_3_plen_358_part_00